MLRRGVGGSSHADHIEMLRNEGEEVPDELELPPCPDQLLYIMGWFDELNAWRRSLTPIVTPKGAIPQTHSLVWADADAWATRTNRHPRPHEWAILQQLEVRYRQAARKAATASISSG